MKQIAVFDRSFQQWLQKPLEHVGINLVSGRAGAFEAAVFSPSGWKGGAVHCRFAVLPGGWHPAFSLQAEEMITYGFSPQDTLTLSSAEGPLLSLQREIWTLDGRRVAPQEIKFCGNFSVTDDALCAVAALLTAGLSVEQVRALPMRF